MNFFSSETSVGVAQAFVVLGVFYLVLMMFGAFTIRIPADAGDLKVMLRRKSKTNWSVVITSMFPKP